ncbi:MAG: hypothetical protein M1830_001807 [Pleopsidium flavum]|nr:MAG: hypothetical protein M1830_002485 [Pleopsidium flavum]KAI9878124.1 MAG: hypothetical protein M1830_001807 [Pleopsidium flavum]
MQFHVIFALFSVSIAAAVPTTGHGRAVISGVDQTSSKHIAAHGSPVVRRDDHARITNDNAFSTGAGNTNSANTRDGVGDGVDQYTYYSGPASDFPDQSQWVSFENMFKNNKPWMLSFCGHTKWGPDDTGQQVEAIRDAIQLIAQASHVDHRFILAVIMQESGGCVWVPTTGNGVTNPGLMQSHDGTAFNPKDERNSIFHMVQDGTQGTGTGPGLTQAVNAAGDLYSAARIYNSGAIASNGDLSDGNGATPCYVSDIANRLTGWVYAESPCSNE